MIGNICVWGYPATFILVIRRYDSVVIDQLIFYTDNVVNQ